MEIEYKNIEEQMELIRQKNIIFKDEERAKEILLRENYYNLITGYKDIFIDIKNTKRSGIETCDEETYFEEIYAIYTFDRELRNLMFKYISTIETNVKSYITNVFSQKYGTKNYLKIENFNVLTEEKPRFEKLIEIINNNIKRNLDNYEDIRKCKEEYGDIPLWMLTSLITFGNIIKFYIFMKTEDKKQVANLFHIRYGDMTVFLKMLNTIRNIAAHNNLLFNVKLEMTYPIRTNSYYHDKLKIPTKNGKYLDGTNDILSIIIILKRFLESKEYKKFIRELEEMIQEVKEELDAESYENFLEEMGIPTNYTMLEEL